MADTITVTVPSDSPDKSIRRVKQTAETARRDAEIVREYPNLRDKHGRDEAFRRLAERHCCSTRTVRRVVYGE